MLKHIIFLLLFFVQWQGQGSLSETQATRSADELKEGPKKTANVILSKEAEIIPSVWFVRVAPSASPAISINPFNKKNIIRHCLQSRLCTLIKSELMFYSLSSSIKRQDGYFTYALRRLII